MTVNCCRSRRSGCTRDRYCTNGKQRCRRSRRRTGLRGRCCRRGRFARCRYSLLSTCKRQWRRWSRRRSAANRRYKRIPCRRTDVDFNHSRMVDGVHRNLGIKTSAGKASGIADGRRRQHGGDNRGRDAIFKRFETQSAAPSSGGCCFSARPLFFAP